MQQVNQQQRQQEVRENVRSILQQVRQTALEAGRDPQQVQVMAVTKTVAPELVNAAIAEGITLLGENKAQELCEKYPLQRRDRRGPGLGPGRLRYQRHHGHSDLCSLPAEGSRPAAQG